MISAMTRPRGKPIYVWTTAEERAEIQRLARATGLSQSAYLRTVGLGYQPASAFDADAVLALARIHADQGRLGGLLKLSLAQAAPRAFPEPVARHAMASPSGPHDDGAAQACLEGTSSSGRRSPARAGSQRAPQQGSGEVVGAMEGTSNDFSGLVRQLHETQAKLLEAIKKIHRPP
jgi:hypothetical protein